MSPPPLKLEHVIARQMATLREERGWTQADLAHLMREAGVTWSANRVTQLETLRGKVSLYEVVALSWLFEVPVTKLLEGDEEVEFPNGEGQLSLDTVRKALTGDSPIKLRTKKTVKGKAEASFVMSANGVGRIENDETRKIAKNLNITTGLLNYIARQLWDQSFIVERNVRVGDTEGLSKRSVQGKRGHATRAMVAEITAYLEKRDPEDLEAAYRAWRESRQNSLLNQLTSSPAITETLNQANKQMAAMIAAHMPRMPDVQSLFAQQIRDLNAQLGLGAATALKPWLEQINAMGSTLALGSNLYLVEQLKVVANDPAFAETLRRVQEMTPDELAALDAAAAEQEDEQENPLNDRTGNASGEEAAGEEEAADAQEQGR